MHIIIVLSQNYQTFTGSVFHVFVQIMDKASAVTLAVGGTINQPTNQPTKLLTSLAKHVHALYTPLNPTFIWKSWGMQGYRYFSYFCSKT